MAGKPRITICEEPEPVEAKPFITTYVKRCDCGWESPSFVDPRALKEWLVIFDHDTKTCDERQMERFRKLVGDYRRFTRRRRWKQRLRLLYLRGIERNNLRVKMINQRRLGS